MLRCTANLGALVTVWKTLTAERSASGDQNVKGDNDRQLQPEVRIPKLSVAGCQVILRV